VPKTKQTNLSWDKSRQAHSSSNPAVITADNKITSREKYIDKRGEKLLGQLGTCLNIWDYF
jgi:hypothetical protein